MNGTNWTSKMETLTFKPVQHSTAALQTMALAVLLLMGLSTFISRMSSRGKPLPGPRGIPLFGNMFQLPKSRPWVKLEEWTREYGPIYQIRLGRTSIVVVGRAPVALELLDKRSAKYSSRPRMIMTSELVSRSLRMTFMPYGELWRKERRLLHQLTATRAAEGYERIQDGESTVLLRDMVKNPKAYWGHCQRYAGSTIMQIAFNKRAKAHTDPAITEMRSCNEKMTHTAVAGRYLVDSIPVLNYLPKMVAPWKREADDLFNDTLSLFTKHYRDVQKSVEEGMDVHCFAKYIQESRESYGLNEDEAIFLAGAMYGAGSDTTADAISTFILCMVTHPEVLAKAQSELDEVVGRARLPDFTDKVDLLYCNAIVREVMRWRTVIAGGLAHSSVEDDVYEGYFIPKGTTVLANHWAIHLDPEVYPEPDQFKPERFIKNNELIGTKYAERGHHSYGFGRRICPGMHIADRSLYIVFTRMMWALTMSKKKNAAGEEIRVDINAYSEGFSSHPLPFANEIKVRGDWVEEIVDLATQGM